MKNTYYILRLRTSRKGGPHYLKDTFISRGVLVPPVGNQFTTDRVQAVRFRKIEHATALVDFIHSFGGPKPRYTIEKIEAAST